MSPNPGLLRGAIVRLVRERGFGFIRADGTDFFFHKSGCIDDFHDLGEGHAVQFEIEGSNRGPRAVNVEKV